MRAAFHVWDGASVAFSDGVPPLDAWKAMYESEDFARFLFEKEKAVRKMARSKG